ncbi:hypothetical protein BK61_06895 [Neisseria gonorrhoeae]|nr:hypothetical protein BK61_06895 [Neisseria gonorrhoeae]
MHFENEIEHKILVTYVIAKVSGRLKTRRGHGGGFAYTTARPQRRFAPSFLPSTSLGRKAGFHPPGQVWACLVCIPQVSDGLFLYPLPPNPICR